MKITTNLKEHFPFISVVLHVNQEYVGVIINQDSQITSMYDYELLRTKEHKEKFLELSEDWWWQSNRKIPISIFLRQEIYEFSYAIRNFNTKDIKVLFGPVTSLNNILEKRIKRKSITVVRRIKP